MLRKTFSQLRELKTQEKSHDILADNYMFKVNNRTTRTRCEISSKLTIKTPERRQWRHSGVFIINFEQFLHHVLVFLSLNLNMQMPTGLRKLEFEMSQDYQVPPQVGKILSFSREFIIDLLQGRTERVNRRLILNCKNKEKT